METMTLNQLLEELNNIPVEQRWKRVYIHLSTTFPRSYNLTDVGYIGLGLQENDEKNPEIAVGISLFCNVSKEEEEAYQQRIKEMKEFDKELKEILKERNKLFAKYDSRDYKKV